RLVRLQDSVDLLHREGVQLHDLRDRAVRGRHDLASLLLVVRVHDHPGPVVAVAASPVGVRQKVRTRLEEHLDDPRAGDQLFVVRNLDEEACHGHVSPCDADSPYTRGAAEWRTRGVMARKASSGTLLRSGLNSSRRPWRYSAQWMPAKSAAKIRNA